MGSQAFPEPLRLEKVRTVRARRGSLTIREFFQVLDHALDSNRVSREPGVRYEWHRLLDMVASRSSGWCPDAACVDTASDRWGQDGLPLSVQRGLFCLSPAEFARNHMPGLSYNVYDAVSNAAAFIRQVIALLGLNPDDEGTVRDAYGEVLRRTARTLTRGTLGPEPVPKDIPGY